MLRHSVRYRLLHAARAMCRRGLNQGTSGNISLRLPRGFLVTPSALLPERCRPGDMVLLDMNGRILQGTRRPSSEWRLHRDIYRHRPDVGAVLHAHPPWSTTLACLRRDIPPIHYTIAVSGGNRIPCAEYALFGSQQLSDHVLSALGHDGKACLLAHHGIVCCERDLDKVLALAGEVEYLARIYAQMLSCGGIEVLGSEEMAEVRKRFERYRNSQEPAGA